MTGGGVTANTERRAFLFNATMNTFTAGADLHTGRFYPTTVTLADGTALTLFGEDHANAPGTGVQSLEIFTPGGAGSWSPPKQFRSTISTILGRSSSPAAISLSLGRKSPRAGSTQLRARSSTTRPSNTTKSLRNEE
jgi:hypothetical protein